MKRVFLVGGLVILGLAALVCGLIIYPKPLFAYTLAGKSLRVYSDEPIDEQGGRAFLAGAEAVLAKWPLAPQQKTYDIFVTNSRWRRALLFTYNFDAGGVVYYFPSGRNAFLSGADFPAGTLIAPSGFVPPPPRTLVYYGAHEVAHLLTGEAVGMLRFARLPVWIREGLADYVAMEGARDFPELAKAVGGLKEWPPIEVIHRFGVYPKYRLLVAHFIEREGWSIRQLLNADLSFEKADARFAAALLHRGKSP
jgi:hypothetical protein